MSTYQPQSDALRIATIAAKAADEKQDIQIYNNPLYYPDPNTNYGFSVGQYVYAIEPGTNYFSKAFSRPCYQIQELLLIRLKPDKPYLQLLQNPP